MAITDAATLTGAFRLGRALARIGAALRTHGLKLALASLLLVGAPGWAFNVAFHADASWPADTLISALLTLLFYALGMTTGSFITAWATLAMVWERKRGPWTPPLGAPGEVMRRAAAITLQSLINQGVGLVGLVLMALPGIVFLSATVVATPALVAEGLSPLKAFARSRDLTAEKGAVIAGLVAVWLGLLALLRWLLIHPIWGVFSAAGRPTPLTLGAAPLLGSLAHVVFATCVASLYVELVAIKTGGPVASIGEVFD